MQEVWHIMGRLSLQIIDRDKGEKFQVNGIDLIFNKVTEESFHKLRQDKSI